MYSHISIPTKIYLIRGKNISYKWKSSYSWTQKIIIWSVHLLHTKQIPTSPRKHSFFSFSTQKNYKTTSGIFTFYIWSHKDAPVDWICYVSTKSFWKEIYRQPPHSSPYHLFHFGSESWRKSLFFFLQHPNQASPKPDSNWLQKILNLQYLF